MATGFDFELIRGRYHERNGVAKDNAGNVMGIADPVKVEFYMESLDDSAYYLSKSTDAGEGITKVSPGDGTYTITFNHDDLADFPTGDYIYEIAYIDNPSAPAEVYTENPKATEEGVIRVIDSLIEVE